MYARLDVSGLDVSSVLGEAVWASVPEGQKLLTAEEAWEKADGQRTVRTHGSAGPTR
jgi:hypothetical protein